MSEAAKYDEAVKSKCVSQNIDSGVSILSAETDVQHCVSTVVVNCAKSGWVMSILPRSLGNSSWSCKQIAEVGFCEGLTPLCDWLREAHVDHEVDWPSACTTLKALSKVAPAEVQRSNKTLHEPPCDPKGC